MIVFKLTPLQVRRCGVFFRCELRLFWRADLPVRPSMHISHSGRSTISYRAQDLVTDLPVTRL